MIPKPPPPFRQSEAAPALKPQLVTGFWQSQRYSLPMAGEIPAWVAMLRHIRYPTTVVTLDFESYFDDDYGLRDLSPIEYVTHDKWEVLGLAHLTVDGAAPFVNYEDHVQFEVGEEKTLSHLRYLQGLYGPALEGCTVAMQNAPFDALVLAKRYGISPAFIIDTVDLARQWNARQPHGLAELAKQFGLPAKGVTEDFKGLTARTRWVKPKSRKKGPKMPVTMPLATPEQLSKLAGYAMNDVARQWEVFTLLMGRVSNPLTEFRVMRHTLNLILKPTLMVDFEHGQKLVTMYTEELNKEVSATGCSSEEISGNKSFAALMIEALTAAGDDISHYMKDMKAGPALAMAKADDEREELLTHGDLRVRQLMGARVAQKSWPLHIARVLRIMSQAMANDGVLCAPLLYHGGHTGRYSGGWKINLQNLSKNGILALIRKLLIAPPGHLLVVVDAAAIEARVLAWIAGQWDLVDKFAKGEEIYCGFAEKVLGYPVRKPRKDGGGIPAIEKKLLWARNSIGKIGILGCGYGMGQEKIFGMGAGEIDLDMALKIRDTYRSENQSIVQFWKTIEKAFCYTAKYKKPAVIERGIRFDAYSDCDVVMTLPNGREMHYIDVKLKPDKYGDKIEVYNGREHKWEHLWGGTLTENCVQAMARDVLVEAMLRLEDQGIHTALSVHDELVMVVEEEQAQSALVSAISALSETPKWADRMPLSAEGSVMKCYQK